MHICSAFTGTRNSILLAPTLEKKFDTNTTATMFLLVHDGVVVLSLLVLFFIGECVRDENISCREWAEVDMECSKNPRFMWGSCQPSCLKAARDEHEECRQWAQEGECSANPRYVPIHCPVSCEYAIAWNTWLREQLEIDRMNPG